MEREFQWKDEADISPEPLNECLVEGTALIYGVGLRMEAYELVRKVAPESVGILEKGRLGVDICARFDGENEWQLGQIVPVLLSNQNRTALEVRHLMKLDDAIAKSINEKVVRAKLPADEINWQALEVFKADTVRLPDLRPINVEMAWLANDSKINNRINRLLTQFFVERGGDLLASARPHA